MHKTRRIENFGARDSPVFGVHKNMALNEAENWPENSIYKQIAPKKTEWDSQISESIRKTERSKKMFPFIGKLHSISKHNFE